ncbi:hypothetical protein Btru_061139 [Bulinus truncatus]|nr:hypothetical protein Btru_061139 [Bulinus truncatus]
MASEEGLLQFVERAESFLDTPKSPTLILQKTISQSSLDVQQTTVESESVTSGSSHELARSVSTENQRTEVNVEVQGIRETCLSSSENVVTTRIRTVYSRSSSSGPPDTNAEGHLDGFGQVNIAESSDSAFTTELDEGEVFEENGQRTRKSSDSYFIKQTYQISSSESTSLSVTAIQNVTFRSSKDVEITGASSTEGGLHTVERTEEVIAGDEAATLGSPKEKQSHLEWLNPDRLVDQGLDKLKTARQDVQQLIQSSYMVSDIASVIDNDSMGPDSLRVVTQGYSTVSASAQGSSVDSQVSDAGQSSAVHHPGDLTLKRESDDATQDRESPPRLTYSPGIAIRSYALEELSEKKSRCTPDRIEAAVRSTRFDEESSQVDIDMGRSVDELNPSDTIPHLKKVDFSKFKNKNNQSSARDVTTEEVNMFTLTKIQKVTLSDESETVTDNGKDSAAQETNREEEDELLDQLVDLQSIQVGYRFHDVGMMMHEAGGICNMAFDDSDDTDAAVQPAQICLSMPSQTGSTVELTDSQQSSTQPTESSPLFDQSTGHEVSSSTEASSSYLLAASASVTKQSTGCSSTIQGDTKLLHVGEGNNVCEFLNETVSNEPQSAEDSSKTDVNIVLTSMEVSTPDAAVSDSSAASREAEHKQMTKSVNDVFVINTNISPASSSYIESLTQVITAEIQQVVRSETSSRQVSDKLDTSGAQINEEPLSTNDSLFVTKSKEDYTVESQSNLSREMEHATSTVVSTQATVKGTEGYQSSSSEITSGGSLNMSLSMTEQKQMSNISSVETTVSVTKTSASSAASSESLLIFTKEALNQTNTLKQVSASAKVEKAQAKEAQVKVAKEVHLKAPLIITRKFNMNEKFESVLKSQGGVLKSESVFIDIYFDTPNFDLTLADCWLRTHNGRWQLHANFSKLLNDGTKHEYFETEDTRVILATLELVLRAKSHQATADASVALFVVKSGLKEFVRYRTKRKTYLSEDLTVELELPEYGFWVGSVTTGNNGYHRPCDAVNRIYSFWKKTVLLYFLFSSVCSKAGGLLASLDYLKGNQCF